MRSSGQSALEYLLLIGGAILIVGILLSVLLNFGAGGKIRANESQNTYQNRINNLCVGDCPLPEQCNNNGNCDFGENSLNCPNDCKCGNGACDIGETPENCPSDCTANPCNSNGTCDVGEDFTNCPADCSCGNGVCDAGEDFGNCSVDCSCGNGTCDSGETPENCSIDCKPVELQVLAYGVSPNEKILPLDSVGTDWNFGGISIFSAKNEFEPFQVVLVPKSDFENVELRLSDLTGTSGQTISAGNISVHIVKYVDISLEPALNRRIGEADYWPDPLWPFDYSKEKFSLKSGEKGIFWITVYVPENTLSGNYSGKLALYSDGNIVSDFNINLNVWNFSLPKKTNLESLFNGWVSIFVKTHLGTGGSVSEKQKVIQMYLEDFSKHNSSPMLYQRVGQYLQAGTESNPISGGRIFWKFTKSQDSTVFDEVDVNFENFESTKDYLFNNLNLRSFNFAPYLAKKENGVNKLFFGECTDTNCDGTHNAIDKNNPNFGKIASSFFQQMGNYFEKNNLLDRAVYYIWDEPAPADLNALKEIASLVRQGHSGIRIGLSSYLQDFYVITNFVDTLVDENGNSLIDIWIPHISSAYYLSPQIWLSRGSKKLWIYDTGKTSSIDNSGERNRLLPWTAWQFNATGILYYATNYWLSNVWCVTNSNSGSYRYLYGTNFYYYPANTEVNPLNLSTQSCSLPYSIALPSKSTDKPVPSIRWELVREGEEDFEYLNLLDKISNFKETPELLPAILKAKDILERVKQVPRINSVGFSVKTLEDSGKIQLGEGWEIGGSSTDPKFRAFVSRRENTGTPTKVELTGLKDGNYGIILNLFIGEAAYPDGTKARGSSFYLNGTKYDYVDYRVSGKWPSNYWLVRLPGSFEAKNNSIELEFSRTDSNTAVFISSIAVNELEKENLGITQIRKDAGEIISEFNSIAPQN